MPYWNWKREENVKELKLKRDLPREEVCERF